MSKQILHVPRGSTKSYIQKLQEDQLPDRIRGFNSNRYTNISSFLIDEEDEMKLDNNLIFTNDSHTAYKTKVRHLMNCDFTDVKDDFKVYFGCRHCKHQQQITDTDLLFGQFIRKPITSFADIRIFCGSCGKSTVIPNRAFIKSILINYTQQDKSTFNVSLDKLINKLKQILQFDCMLNGKTSYMVESDNLKDLIYD